MILRNKTRQTTLTSTLIPAVQLKKIRGLMGVTKPESLLLKTHFGIHTFFLKFPVDVLILDTDLKVVRRRLGIKPWNVYVWHPKYGTVIELPEGSIEKSKTEIGDQLHMV